MSEPLGEPHGIQLRFVGVRNLAIDCILPPEKSLGVSPGELLLNVSRSKYDREEKNFLVKMSAEINAGEGVPFTLKVVIIGIFGVDESKFDFNKVEQWAEKGAGFVLYPYLREHVYGLVSRAGYTPIILPLLALPSGRVAPDISIPTSEPVKT